MTIDEFKKTPVGKKVSEKGYVLDTKAGLQKGGAGTVYKALKDENWYAIKVIDHPRYDIYMNEIQCMKKINSKYVMKITDYFYEENAEYRIAAIIMPYIDVTLSEIMNDSNIYKDEHFEQLVLKIGKDLCCGLEECHCGELIHKDVKPSNIFFDGENYILGDFGVSKLGRGETVIKGITDKYCAPEYKKNNRSNAQVDIYSVGVILLEILNGGYFEYIEWWNYKDGYLKNIKSEKLRKIIKKTIQTDPKKRYGTITDLRNALEKYEKEAFSYEETIFLDESAEEHTKKKKVEIKNVTKIVKKSVIQGRKNVEKGLKTVEQTLKKSIKK